MIKDIQTKVAAVLLAFFFLSNDVIASVHFLRNLPENTAQNKLSYCLEAELSEVAQPIKAALQIPASSEEPAQRKETTRTPEVSGLIYTLKEKSAFLGNHPNDQVGHPQDDVFDFVLSQDVSHYAYALISYETKGVESGQKLPLTINGNYLSPTQELKAGDQWNRQQRLIPAQHFKNGNNKLWFSFPSFTSLGVEVKGLKIEFTNTANELTIENATSLTQALPQLFAVKEKPDLQHYALADEQMHSIPKSLQNVTMGASGYRAATTSAEALTITMAVDPARLLGVASLKET